MITPSGSSKTVLIFAPTASDANLAVETLKEAKIDALACSSSLDFGEKLSRGCGAVIVSEEALTTETLTCLQNVLALQETWSDLPIILLTSADVVQATEIFSSSGNISLLERPFSRLTLIRSAEVALRARNRQYEVRDLLLDLKKSKDAAERANTAKSQFLANMSHEIRTPIGAIMGFIELLKSSSLSAEDRLGYIGIIERNSQQLLHLIDDILDLSKVEAGKMSIEHIAFNLKNFLGDFISNMKFKSAEKGLNFKVKLNSAIPAEIISDPMRLKQILTNVVGNAIKFTERGFIELNISYARPYLNFQIKDSGIGLTPQQMGSLFQPFKQADSSTTRKFGGTGLGLVVSRKLAEILGGQLDLESSEHEKGSCFTVSILPEILPNVKMLTEAEMTIALPKPILRPNAQELKGLRVLLVEDSMDNQLLISKFLRSTGATVEVRSNGAEGVDAALKEPHDLILMDIQMPVMDGHEATKKLRLNLYSKPIIALTAHAMNDEKKKCFASGFTDYLSKPIRTNLLIEMLARYRTPFMTPAQSS